jgi:hypothetical protein
MMCDGKNSKFRCGDLIDEQKKGPGSNLKPTLRSRVTAQKRAAPSLHVSAL